MEPIMKLLASLILGLMSFASIAAEPLQINFPDSNEQFLQQNWELSEIQTVDYDTVGLIYHVPGRGYVDDIKEMTSLRLICSTKPNVMHPVIAVLFRDDMNFSE